MIGSGSPFATTLRKNNPARKSSSQLADHTSITCQDVYLILPHQVLAKELPEPLRQEYRCILKALDGSVTAAIFGPERKSQHRHPPGHGEPLQ